MNVNPFGRWILVKPLEKQRVLVSDEGSLSEYGEVIAVGPVVKEIKIGDRVGFSLFGVEKLIIEEQKFYFIMEDDEFLLATIVD